MIIMMIRLVEGEVIMPNIYEELQLVLGFVTYMNIVAIIGFENYIIVEAV